MKQSKFTYAPKWPLALATVSAFALSASFAAAQDAPAPATEPAKTGPRTQLETVVTSATRVETSAQTTPVATTSVSGAQLERTFAVDLRDLTSQAPNVNLEPVGAFQNASAFYIRGFGSADIESATDPGVGIFIDGVYQARTSTALSDLLDITNVEILRGPQGTLFGRNTIVGAVLVSHAKPDTSEFDVKGEFTAGNYGELDISGVINVPLIEGKAGMRLAVKSTNNDGFYKNATDGTNYGGTDRITILPSFRFTPNDNLDIVIRGEIVRERDDSWGNTPYSACGGANGVFNPFAANNYGTVPGNVTQLTPLVSWAHGGQEDLDKVCAQERGKNDFIVHADNTSGRGSDFDVYGITGEFTYDVPDFGTFTYVGNYRDVHEDVFNDFDTTDLPIFMTQREQWHNQTSHELRFASSFSDTIDFVAGFYFFHQKYRMWQDTYGWLFDPGFAGALGSAIVGRLTGAPNPGAALDALNPNASGFGETIQANNAWAAFINANWHIWEGITLTAGLRYNKEKKDIETCAPSPVNDGVNRECNLNPAIGNFFDSDTDINTAAGRKNNWSNVSPKVGLSWEANDDLFLYASWTRGFRSGGFNGRCGSTATCQPFNEETADSYEVGMKWDGMDNRLRVNLTGFYLDYKDQQVSIIRQSSGSGGGQETVTDNAANAKSKGVELEVTTLPADGLTIWGSLGWLKSSRDFCTDIDGPSTVNPGPASGSCDPDNAFSYLDNGTTFYIFPTQVLVPNVRAPKWTLAAGFAYEVPVGNAGTIELAGDWRYQSKNNQASNGVPAGLVTGLLNYNGVLVTPIRGSAHIFNASITWREIEDRYRISLFMKNIGNAHYMQSLTAVATLFNFIQDNNPRTYGVKVSFDF